MPHVNIKCYPGRSEAQKRLLAERITNDVAEVFQVSAKSVSVAIQDVPEDEWDEQVWDREIVPQRDFLYKEPGYTREE